MISGQTGFSGSCRFWEGGGAGIGEATLFALAVVPAWLASAAAILLDVAVEQAAGHLAVLGLVGFVLAELCLQSFRKIPFTCSYLPGKTHFNIAVMVFVGLVVLMKDGAEVEGRALVGNGRSLAAFGYFRDRGGFAAMAGGMVAVGLAGSPEEEIEFEDTPAPAVMVLGLNRDGTSPV